MMPLSLFFAAFLAAAFLCALSTAWLLPRLRRRKLGQTILEIGPVWHAPKEGTPTMGGLSFLFAALLSGGVMLLLLWKDTPTAVLYPFCISLLFATLNGAVGIIDDLTKFRHHRNDGLTPTQKIILQTTLGAAYLALLRLSGYADGRIFLFGAERDLGFFLYFVYLLLLLGVTNCANLTDGIDGLAAAVAAVIGGVFSFLSGRAENLPALCLSAILLGCSLAFLFFNRHPARIFMGDTGSLFLGAMVAAIPFLLGRPFLSLVCGVVYVVEGASVILQVLYYKATHRRLFLMAPIHHHFEKCGWSENRIVAVFSGLTLVSGVLACFLP